MTRSGKTFIIVFAIIIRACKVKSRHVMLRQTFNSIKTSIWLDTLIKVLAIAFPQLSYSLNKTDYYVTLPNGSEIWIAGLDDDKRVEKILGKEFSTIFFNECSQLSYSSVQVALTRLAEKNSLKKKAYFDENPPSKKHWSYWLFVKKQDPVENEPLEDPEEYASMIINPKDNLANIDEDYIKMLSKMPEKERQRFLDGLFTDEDDGAAYYAFDRERHVKPCKRTVGTIFISMDFNVNPMTASIGQFINETFYIFDEVFLENSDTYKMVAELKRRNYYGTVIPDSTGKNRKTSGRSDFQILEEAGYTIPYVRNPFVVDRVNNANRLFTADRIIIDPKCKKLIGDFEKVSWKDNKLDQKTDTMLTHCSDNAGYMFWHIEPIEKQYNSKGIILG
tara:strand:- start:703 stop:1875 length:1173 start_codon:yes stop_codon:yes gene_type:complete